MGKENKKSIRSIIQTGLIFIIIFSLIQINHYDFHFFDETSASSSWNQETAMDLDNGTFDDTSIINDEINLELALNSGNWINKNPPGAPWKRDNFAMAQIWNTDKVFIHGYESYIYSSSTNTWTQKFPAKKPGTREWFDMACVDGTDKVVLFGGVYEGDRLDDTWIYDASANTWTQKFPAVAPGGRNGHVMAPIYGTDKVLLFGGYNSTDSKYYDETWTYDLSINIWSKFTLSTKPVARSRSSIAPVWGTDNIVLFGGRSSSVLIDDTWIFDHSEISWTEKTGTPKPSDRMSQSMATIHGTDRVVLFGGWEYFKTPYHHNDTWEYNLTLNTWTKIHLPLSPGNRSDHQIANIYGTDKILLFGGDGVNILYNDTWIYDSSAQTWTEKSFPEKPPYYSSWPHVYTGIYGTDKVLFIDTRSYSYNTWLYDSSENKWTRIYLVNEPPVWAEFGLAPIYGTDKVVLFGGMDRKKYRVHETWIYDLSESTWSNVTPIESPSEFSLAEICSIWGDDKVFYYTSTETWIFDFSENKWTNITSLNRPELGGSAFSAIPYSNKIILIGYWRDVNDRQVHETWIYDLNTDNWTLQSSWKTWKHHLQRYSIAPIKDTGKVILLSIFWDDDIKSYVYETSIFGFGYSNWTLFTSSVFINLKGFNALTPIYSTGAIFQSSGQETLELNYSRFYIANGNYESEIFDTKSEPSFNQLLWLSEEPDGTDIKFQIRTGINDTHIRSRHFVGPDGEYTSYYTSPPANLWAGHQGDRMVQYKAYLSTLNDSLTPILREINISYNILPEKPILVVPVDSSLTVLNKATFTWKFIDQDTEEQGSFQWQLDDDEQFGSIDYDSGEVQSSSLSYTPSSPIDDGIWYWRIKTKDADGAWGPFSNISKLTIDTTIEKPIDVTANHEDWTNNGTFIIDWIDPSDLTGIKDGAYYYIGSSPPISQQNGTWGSKKPLVLSDVPEGNNFLFLWLEDNLGNTDHLECYSVPFRVDFTKPSNLLLHINEDSKYANSTSVDLKIDADDLVSGIDKMSFSFNNIEWTEWETYVNSTSIKLPSGDGEKTIYFEVSDKAGNIAGSSNSIVLDTEEPFSLSLTIAKIANVENKTTITLRLDAKDNLSGIDKASYSFDGESWTSWEDFISLKQLDVPLDMGYGTKIIYFKVNDKAGNVAEPTSAKFNITEPETEVDSDNDDYPDDIDAFPNNASEWNDTDNDNFGDNIDAFPDDPTRWEAEDELPDGEKKGGNKNGSDSTGLIVGIIAIVIIMLIISIYFLLIVRKKKDKNEKGNMPIPEQNQETPITPIQPQNNSLGSPPPQPQWHPQHQPLNLCSSCGQQQSFIQENNKNYCFYCKKYE